MRSAVFISMMTILSAGAHAQDSIQKGGYMGFAVGTLSYEETEQLTGLEISDDTSAYRLFGGYQFNENFALEAGWAATGDIKEDFTGTDAVLGDVALSIKGDYEVLSLRLLGIVPLSKVNLFGGVGYYDATLSATGRYEDDFDLFSVSVKDSDGGATVLGGLQFNLARVGIRAEYEWFDTDSSVEASSISAGVFFRF